MVNGEQGVIEPELKRPAPRRVVPAQGWPYRREIVLVLVFLGCVLFARPDHDFTIRRAQKSGVDAEAHVTQSWTRTSRRHTNHYSAYTYNAMGQTYTGKGLTSGPLSPGDSVAVRYLSGSPEQSVTMADVPQGLPFCAFVLIVVGIVFADGLLRRRLARRLVEKGIPIAARIKQTFERKRGIDLELEIEHEGSRRIVSRRIPSGDERIFPGDTLTVLIDSRNPKNAVIYRYCGYRAL